MSDAMDAVKGLETDEQRKWFFANLAAGNVGNGGDPAVPHPDTLKDAVSRVQSGGISKTDVKKELVATEKQNTRFAQSIARYKDYSHFGRDINSSKDAKKWLKDNESGLVSPDRKRSAQWLSTAYATHEAGLRHEATL